MTKTCIGKDGNETPGQFVSRQVQLKHHLADMNASTSSHFSPSHNSFLEPDIAEDQISNSKGSNLGFEELQLDFVDLVVSNAGLPESFYSGCFNLLDSIPFWTIQVTIDSQKTSGQ
ncbi:hypothetical protein CROQUDRAFT_90886 [Cronartium quercuum f. sp. fusiforme G11]|uniref:Uncharacterized protein n=1 Tax=Cronartium quercuum f. sp. fusiforme G11 TaxID=708437 RepID=A0A9P6TD02_9BASI|nr:hypothetical protein CROQUDRAFT_90886 [Cronartium quercuum f. sp. fusiforme G11]